MHLKKGTNVWKYIDLENNLLQYKVIHLTKDSYLTICRYIFKRILQIEPRLSC